MKINKLVTCNKCGVYLRSYWLKDGICNACRNPDLVVTAIVKCNHPAISHSGLTAGDCLVCGENIVPF